MTKKYGYVWTMCKNLEEDEELAIFETRNECIRRAEEHLANCDAGDTIDIYKVEYTKEGSIQFRCYFTEAE